MKNMKLFTLSVLLVAVGIVGGFVWKSSLNQNVPDEVVLELPEGAIQLTPCVPFMGEHWAKPEDLPSGPIYIVHEGKVIGSEYMIFENRLEDEILDMDGHQVGVPVSLPSLGVEYDHTDVGYQPHGHEGMEAPHYDIHHYLISPEEKFSICPPSFEGLDEPPTMEQLIQMYMNYYPSTDPTEMQDEKEEEHSGHE